MNPDDRKLTAAFRALDDVEREEGVSPHVEARLRTQVRSIGAARRRERIHTELARAAAIVIAVSGVVFVLHGRRMAPPSTGHHVPLAAVEERTAFMPLTYGSVPTRDGEIVRLEVPRAALVPFGLAPPEAIVADASRDTVIADVLVGVDGLARAVRFVRASPQENAQQESQEQSQEKPR